MKNRDLAALGGDSCQAAVGITENQQSVGFHLLQHSVNSNADFANCLGRITASGVEEVIRLTDFEILKEG